MKRQRIVAYSSSESDSSSEEGGNLTIAIDYGVVNGPAFGTNSNVPQLLDTVSGKGETHPNKSDKEKDGSNRPKKRFCSEAISDENHQLANLVNVAEACPAVEMEDDIQSIYQECSEMFNANKITAQNAFSLRLLDCINEMVNSPGFDKTDMLLASSTVEIGTKIYSCRVDNTHAEVKSLASDINWLYKNADPEDENRDYEKMKERARTAKKQKTFVEKDNTKLLTDNLESANVKFFSRRTRLKKKFDDMVYEDIEFDYISFVLEEDDENPLETRKEERKLQSQLQIPRDEVNCQDFVRLDFIPFMFLPMGKFDSEKLDIWGLSVNGVAPVSAYTFQLPINDLFTYDPSRHPVQEEPEEGQRASNPNDEVNDNDECASPVTILDIPSLEDLDSHHQRVKRTILNARYDWVGPVFQRKITKCPTKKRRVRKSQKIDFATINWENRRYNFYPSSDANISDGDDTTIASWSRKKQKIPILDNEVAYYDDSDIDPHHDLLNESDPGTVPRVFQLFTRRNRSIWDNINVDNGENGLGSVDDTGFDQDYDVEAEATATTHHIPPSQQLWNITDLSNVNSQCSQTFSGFYDDHVSGVMMYNGGSEICFSRKPKPINMSYLKSIIVKTLVTHLMLDVHTGLPLIYEETKIDLAYLLLQVLKELDERTEKLLSVAIFFFALLHVVSDKKLDIVYDESDPDCPVVLCKGIRRSSRLMNAAAK